MPRCWVVALVLTAVAGACSKPADDAKPVATPTVRLAAPGAAIESPIDVTYRFVVAPDASPLTQPYRVFVHFNDPAGQQLWTDDHLPPTPTTEWKPGATVEYTRTMFVPKVPYTGEATIDLGLYRPGSDERVPLAGTAVGRRAYRVGTLDVQPQVGSTLVMYGRGWHDAEVVPDSPGVEWRWSKGDATLRFRNPRQDVTLLVDLDQPQENLPGAQQVALAIGTTPLDTFSLRPGERMVRRVAVPAAALGTADDIEVTLTVAPMFTPAYLPGSQNRDVRTLGVRVFHAYIQPGNQPK